MKHFAELKKIITRKEKIDEYIKRIKTIGFLDRFDKNCIGIIDNQNRYYTLAGVENIIGQEKLFSIIEQFEGLINVELHKAKEQTEQEISKFNITVS